MDNINGKQLVVVTSSTNNLSTNTKILQQANPNAMVRGFSDPYQMLRSPEYKSADVFVVDVELGDMDGRTLYLQQKNRLRIVPFLFIINKDITDDDWDYFKEFSIDKDIFDYLRYPYSPKQLIHKVNLMLTITYSYNAHTTATIDGLREIWKNTVIKDRMFLNELQTRYRKERGQ
jgi:DNA-binding response OmpR family regulator